MIVRRVVPTLSSFLLLLLRLLLGAAAAVASEPRVDPAVQVPPIGGEVELGATPELLEAIRRDVLARVDEARRRAGLGALERNAALELAATRHAADMLARGYFAHESPEGETAEERIAAAGHRPARRLGETIAYGQRSAEAVVGAWLASPPHRRILLDRRATESGVGVAVGRKEGNVLITWVELFAEPVPEL